MSEFVVKDSGNRVDFGTGSRRDTDEGKIRPDLSGWDIIRQMVSELTDSELTWESFEKAVEMGFYEQALNIAIRMFITRELRTRLARHMGLGAQKYGEQNWQLGQNEQRYQQSAIRHFWQWYAGLDTEEDHFSAVLFNLFAPYWTKNEGFYDAPAWNFTSGADLSK